MQITNPKPPVKKQKKILVIVICVSILIAYAALTFLPKGSDELPDEMNISNSDIYLSAVNNIIQGPATYSDVVNEKQEVKQEAETVDDTDVEDVEDIEEKEAPVSDATPKKEGLNIGYAYNAPKNNTYKGQVNQPQYLYQARSNRETEQEEAYASSMGYGESSGLSKKRNQNNYDNQPLLAYNTGNPTARTDKLLNSLIDGRNKTEESSQQRYLAQAGQRKDVYLNERIEKPISPYQIMAGSIIPGAMITGINSDLPGEITARVTQNVYDTVTGQHLLIPQGAELLGGYDSGVLYGQNRVLFTWDRMRFPNGESIQLRGMKGVDLGGFSGLDADVDNHYMRLTGAILMSAFLSLGTEKIDNGTTIGQSVSKDVNKSGQKIVDMQLNVRPTLKVYSGDRFNIMVNKDIILKPYRG